ncbi:MULTISPECIES: hypothetical protein [Devosia]|uniref:hypothetical protein n=1 Tax=Devosia TaxID=46913 RepID=UPI000CE9483F|nr:MULTISPECIES: hypothetical protein [Devosia]AVF04733.1 hypothetical protein C4375_14140 [Devosia sp. I507]
MTPEEADQRIILSRQTLHRYRAMMDSGVIPHADTLALWSREIDQLLIIATDHPEKAEKIAALLERWRDLIGKVRTVH